MNGSTWKRDVVSGISMVGLLAAGAMAQTPGATTSPAASAGRTPAQEAQGSKPLQMRTLDSATQADPFPKPNPANFTADSPTTATVDSYLQAMVGWDSNRIWRVEAIQKTNVAGVSKVVAGIAERGAAAVKPQSVVFYVLPDGKHLIADSGGPQPFGARPFAENRAILQARAEGPSHGGTSKDFEMVEFADLQCVRCKEALPVLNHLAQDFPRARIVFQSLPLTEIHPYAYEAALYSACIARENSDAFFTFAQAVYDTQADLLPDKADDTLNAAVAKAGMDPAKIAACSKTPAAKEAVTASEKLAFDLGVEQTPVLVVNGRTMPLLGVSYETLKQIVVHQAQLDGVSALAGTPLISTPAKP